MKKLLIMLSAVALATGAFADEEEVNTLTSGTETFDSFDLTGGPVAISTNTVSGGQKLWYSAGDAEEGETGTVTAYGGDDVKHEDIAGDSNVNYLNVSTTTGTPLYRKLVAHDNEELLNEDSDPVDIGTGIFVDTYVQFSGSETAPDIPDGSKLVVWVQAIDFDDNNTPENTNDDIQGSTNLVITSAMLSDAGEPTATNFVIETAANFNFEGWHRLTIRSIKEITSAGSKIAGFTVFVDDKQLAAKETQIAGAEAVLDGDGETVLTPAVDPVTYNNLMGAYAYAANLTAEAKALYNNRRLFVSLVNNLNDYAQTLSAVGFDGTGKIDKLTVSNDRSDFVFARGDFYFTLTWDNGIADFTVTAKDAEGNELPFTLEMKDLTSGTPFAITNTAAKITISGITPKDGSSLVGDDSRELDLLEYSSLSLTTETALVKIGEKEYSSFAAALSEATAGATLELVKPLTLNQTVLRGDIVLDLAGQDITYEAATFEDDPATEDVTESDLASLFTVIGNGKLKIIDSVGGGRIAYAVEPDWTNYPVLIDATASTAVFILGDADDSVDKGATIAGFISDNYTTIDDAAEGDGGYVQYIRGNLLYLDEQNGSYDGTNYTAYFVDYLYVDGEGNTSSLECDGEYFVITPPTSGEPEETFAVTVVNENTNATYTSDPADLTGLEADTEVTITATAAEGYTYEGVELTGGWTIDANDATKATYTVTVNDNLTVTVPAAVEVEDNVIEVGGEGKEFLSESEAIAATNDIQITVSENDAAVGITADYFKPVINTVNDKYVVEVALDETVIQPSADDAAETFIENLATAEVDEHGIITIKFTGEQVKKGLKYGVAVSESLTGENSIQNATPATWATANDSGVDLKVTKPTNGKGFFKVHIKYETSTPAE